MSGGWKGQGAVEGGREARGRRYWRAADAPPAISTARPWREFPPGAELPPDAVSRREFLRLAAAGAALAGLGGCFEPPRERILPYTARPPEVTPGVARYYATTMTLGGFGTGLLVESHTGRPTKVEGNPDHPASLGATGVYEQASVLDLYDPDRARAPRHLGAIRPWSAFVDAFAPEAGAPDDGTGLRFLLPPTASPTTTRLISAVRDRLPAAGFTFYAPLSPTDPAEGARLALGRPLLAQYDFRAADVVLAADADFLAAMPFALRYARHFTDRRRLHGPDDAMNRLYTIEGVFSVTGATADHRLRVRTAEVGDVLAAILAEVAAVPERLPGGAPPGLATALERFRATGGRERWIRAVARDLIEHAGAGIAIVGERQPPWVHGLAHALNALLGNAGHTVRYTPSPLAEAGASSHTLEPLVAEMRAGRVRTLVILGGNPSYDAPADLEFRRALRAVPRTVYLGLHENETAADCAWFLPMLHYLEAWGDARAYDGTASPIQPLIAPLYGGRTADEVLAVFLGDVGRSAHALVRETWRAALGADFEAAWDAALTRGIFEGTALPPVPAAVQWDPLLRDLATREPRPPAGRDSFEVVFTRDARVYDGRFANNPWLQELPDPLTKLTWDNAAVLGPGTAARLGVRTGDLLALRRHGRELRIPAFILPGPAEDSISIPLGYGRAGAGAVGRGVGANAFTLRTSEAPYFAGDLTVEPLAEMPPVRLATTQSHWSLDGRPVALEATLTEYRENPDFTAEMRRPPRSLYSPFTYTGDQWAMTIDLTVCTGCSACVIACQAENNTPVVGKEDVLKGREMHWLRIDRYFTGDAGAPDVVMQPMLCQHCEKAPCEYVCPVNATVHSPDGLNEMVYNRCIGTRFCSNNCPYKVRRFNWFDYNSDVPETREMQFNPDVTVRARGIMEKCTFCVQRIRRAQIRSRLDGRPLGGNDVQTACAQACPTRAIIFGSLGDPASEVSRTHRLPRSYAVLDDLGTRPRVRYLARIRNPAPTLAATDRAATSAGAEGAGAGAGKGGGAPPAER
ncbi:MAG TPA: Fe-S-cluster-containing hydrogenase [Longimicrobiales bacterium]